MARRDLTFRVFVSSTFSDMRAERRILQEEVFPRLKALCEGKGAGFQAVDLRWGVNEEAQLDQKTMEICLGEIARCQRLSPKPNFIILLGDKYGWQPIPNKIPNNEMELIVKELGEDEKAFVERWYCEDRNAVPPEYTLQPRGDEYRLYADWEQVEGRLRNILRHAVGRLPFTADQKIKYFASATHQEIMRGALLPPAGVINPQEHVFAYLRTIRDLPEDTEAKEYIDLAGDGRDAYSKAQLEKLKKELKGKLPQEHIYDYGAAWNKGCIIDDLQEFGACVYADLSSIIENQLQAIEEVDSLTKEIQQHEAFKKQRLEHFTGQKKALKAIGDYLEGSENKVFTIIGASGAGKTSLMAKAIEEAGASKGVKVFRFIGTTSGTSDTYKLLLEIIRHIAREYGVEMNALLQEREDEQKFSSLRGLQEMFLRCLNLASADKPLLIFLDALDQLARDYASLVLDWIPQELPENVKIVVSALPELKAKLSHTELYEMGPMSNTDGTKLLDKWLASINRTLQPSQKEEVIAKFQANGTPLYLKLAFEKAKEWYSYSKDIVLKADIAGILDGFFDELERTHGSLLVQKFCGYLINGKYQGLMENEFLGLLVFDKEYWDHFIEHCHPDHRQEVTEINKLPIVIWSRLFLDFEPYLTEREADGVSIISFYHRQFNEYAGKRYLSGDLSTAYHHILADYFEEAPLYGDEKEQRPNVRKVVEQPYQETMAGQWEAIVSKSLAHFPILMAKTKADMVEGIMEDYGLAFVKAPQETKEKLRLWEAFFRERAHILRRGNEKWSAYKILLQLAVEHADESPITLGAEAYLNKGTVDWTWIRRMQRVKEPGIDPCRAVLEGHTGPILGALVLSDGRILSWSWDHTLRLWNKEGIPITVLKGHTGAVDGALELSDGRILSWSSDSTPRLWDREGKLLAALEGHRWEVLGVIELSDGRLLSWDGNHPLQTLRIWDKEGKSVAVLEGHTHRVNGARVLSDGRLLSWSDDHTLRLWNKEGIPIVVLEGHTKRVTGVLELSNGSILSWAGDDTLRIWDREGKPIDVLEEHTGVPGALELSNGRILSWSVDNTLRIWNQEGRPIAVLEGHRLSVSGAIVLLDDRILSWAYDHTLRLWDQEGRPIAVLEGHSSGVRGVMELSDGRILSWGHDHTLRLWDRGGELIAVFEGHTDSVTGAFVLSDGRILSWSSDHTLRLWDREGKPITVFKGHTGPVNDALELSDGRILSWSVSGDYTLRLWDREGQTITALKGHTHSVNGTIELSDSRLLSWSWDGLRLWDKEGKALAVLKGRSFVKGELLASQGHRFVKGALELSNGRILSWAEGTLLLWDKGGEPLVVLKGHTHSVNGTIELSDSRLLSWSDDHTLRLWNIEGKPVAVLKGHRGPVLGALMLSDGRILSWSDDATLCLWDKEGKTISVLEGHTESVFGAIELSNNRILSWAADGTLRLWDHKGKPIVVLEGHAFSIIDTFIGALELSDGRILSWSWDGLRLWDKEGKPIGVLKGHKYSVNRALELSDGRILSWAEDHTLRLWDGRGNILSAYTHERGLASFPEYRIASYGKRNVLSNSVLSPLNYTALLHLFAKNQTYHFFWHGSSECASRLLKPDGRIIVTQANGQVCFLHLYHGNKRITIKELEEMYGLEYRE